MEISITSPFDNTIPGKGCKVSIDVELNSGEPFSYDIIYNNYDTQTHPTENILEGEIGKEFNCSSVLIRGKLITIASLLSIERKTVNFIESFDDGALEKSCGSRTIWL